MPPAYDDIYERLVGNVAAARIQSTAEVTPFWPIAGWKYDGSLMVIGRSVNGWIENWAIDQLQDPGERRRLIDQTRDDAEPTDRCRMLWVTDLGGRTGHRYNTNRSAFWRVLRSLSTDVLGADAADWPSSLAWTNLYKLAPAGGWNPAADLQVAQREAAIALLRMEIETLRPRRILALTGGNWFWPFREAVADELQWREGLVVGVAGRGSSAVVVARHPMKKPHDAFVREVRGAFSDLEDQSLSSKEPPVL